MKQKLVPVHDLEVGQEIVIEWPSGSGWGGTVAALSDTVLTVQHPGKRQDYDLARFEAEHMRVYIELPHDVDECVSFGEHCQGPVEYHSPGGNARQMLRCRFHAEQRSAQYDNSMERYADSASAPDWFDPGYAGERWDDDY